MTTAYDNYGDQSPDATPVDRGIGVIPQPVAPKPANVSRGSGFLWTGIALVVISILLGGDGKFADGIAGDALLICAVINIATSGIIRVIVDTRLPR